MASDPRPKPAESTERSAWIDPVPWVAFITLVSVAFWVRGGGIELLSNAGYAQWLAVGQLAGLVAALGALGGLVLVARPRWLERKAGLDRMVGWHRLAGIAAVFGLLIHAVASTVGFAGGSLLAAPAELWRLMTTEAWMMAAVVGGLLFFMVGLTSWGRIKSRMSYETWYFLHFNGYLAVALGFGHQVFVGQTFVEDPFAFWYWCALYVGVAAIVVYSRLGGVLGSVFRRGIKVASVTPVTRDAVAIELTGPGVRRLHARGGQFLSVRFLVSGIWWQSHPFSLSDRPTESTLRLTVKDLGDATAQMQSLRRGTRVLVQGPYGSMAASDEADRKVVLIGAGVGLAPMRALLSECTPAQRPVVLARGSDAFDIPHRQELQDLSLALGGRFHEVTGSRSQWKEGNPFTANQLQAAIPDIADRAAFVCGPPALQSAIESGLRKAGMASEHVHSERFGW